MYVKMHMIMCICIDSFYSFTSALVLVQNFFIYRYLFHEKKKLNILTQ